MTPAKTYNVQFVNYFEDYDPPLDINFKADNPQDVKNIIAALSAFYSGDPCECYINGDQAALESDWGRMKKAIEEQSGNTGKLDELNCDDT